MTTEEDVNKKRELMDKQQQLIQFYKDLFVKYSAERKEKRKNQEVLRRYEAERRTLWYHISQNHQVLLNFNPLPEVYNTAYDGASTTNDEFKSLLTAQAADNNQFLEVMEQPRATEQEKEEYESYKSNEDGNDDPSSMSDEPGTSGKGDKNPSGAPPKPNKNQTKEAPANGEISKNQKSQSATQDKPKNQGTAKDTGVDNAMSAIVKLCNQQFQYLTTQINTQQEQHLSSTTLLQEQMQTFHNQMKNQILDKHSLKPQKLEIPSFDGKILEYKSFKEIFTKAVSKCNWGKLELFLLLQSKLTGRALDRVKHLTADEQNYDIMWAILDKEFLVVRALIQHNVNKLIQPSPAKFNDVTSIRQFYATLNTVVTNLTQLKEVNPTQWLLEIYYSQLDDRIKIRYEDYLRAKTLKATVETITEFLMEECNNIEAQQSLGIKNSNLSVNKPKENPNIPSKISNNNTSKVTRAHVTMGDANNAKMNCLICKTNHYTAECPTLLADEKREVLLRHFKICIYCLKHKYKYNSPCRSKDYVKCDKCNSNHHTLLHPLDRNPSNVMCLSNEEHRNMEQNHATRTYVTENEYACTILPTAIANILSQNGLIIPISCLLDNCAEKSYITEDAVQKLGLKKHKTKIMIKGINNIEDMSTAFVKLNIKLDDPQIGIITTNALVVRKIASNIPTLQLDLNKLGNKKLANPFLDRPCSVGILLGGDILPQLFKSGGKTEINSQGLMFQETHLGWVVSGKNTKPAKVVSTYVTYNESTLKFVKDHEMNEKILRFYEVPEEYKETDADEDKYCEELFKIKHYRLENGRYVVPMPWRLPGDPLGHSYRKALKFFLWQEKLWEKNPEHHKLTTDFMKEYLNMGHMIELEPSNHRDETGYHYYIPYISIFRPTALTTKLRNVFNASAPTSNGLSLNDIICPGPKLQTSIIDVITTARTFKYIVSADIQKMFRQILLLPEDAKRLRIIWRESKHENIREFQLATVTYGCDAAPYQSIRTIMQCAIDNSPSKEIEQIIIKGFYVDDFLYGHDNIEGAQKLVKDVNQTMIAGQFPLTKFMSNHPEVLKDVDNTKKITAYTDDNTTYFKTLGLNYDPIEDEYSLNVKPITDITYSKRGISSIAAKTFDPLGFMLPFTILLRLFLQKVWMKKYDWDDILDTQTQNEFDNLLHNMPRLAEIKIKRWFSSTSEKLLELIGFSDSSGLAKAAVIYSRVRVNDEYKTCFVYAKGNVNKIKNQAVIASSQETIPKLELQALLLLAEMLHQIKQCFTHLSIKLHAYVDSKIVIYWMRSKKSLKNKYVQKKVNKIKALINPENIHHVGTRDNPADVPSRPRNVDELLKCQLWINGPDMIRQESLPTTTDSELYDMSNDIETVNTLLTKNSDETYDMFDHFSNYNRLIRSVAFILRWITFKKAQLKEKNSKTPKEFDAEEIKNARKRVIIYYQQLILGGEIQKIKTKKLLPKGHFLRKLSPFIDDDGILKVGGRLQNATFLTNGQIHPIIIPKSKFLTLLLKNVHVQNFHAHFSLMQRLIVENYWVSALKSNIHRIIYNCHSCTRWLSKPYQPEMAQLPTVRLQPSGIFENVGVDLCGYFNIKASPLKFDRTIKAYVVIFVCMVTKSTHLEVIKAISTEEFLLALSRFSSRRSCPHTIYSDNGSNFIGCNRILNEAWKKVQTEAKNSISMREINWKYIPRFSPNFGGLWEAGVKSIKYFVKRFETIKGMTIDEFQTIICRIEYYMNSRPLYAHFKKDISQYSLTPFHFILQKSATLHPIELTETKLSLTSKWLQIVQLQKEFWKIFVSEYLIHLQKKIKWIKPQKNLNVNDIVIVKEPHLLPGQWKLAQVTQTYPDPSGTVRKVQVQESNKSLHIHAVNQLIPLPIESQIKEQNILDNERSINESIKQKNAGTIPRKNRLRRNLTKPTIIHVILTCTLLMFTSTHGHMQLLQAGMHAIDIGEVQIKYTDMDIMINTQYNVTKDKLLIQEYIHNFTHSCTLYDITLTSYCTQWEKLIKSEASQVLKVLETTLPARTKRSGGAIAAKFAIYLVPHLIVGGFMAYQQIELAHLQNTMHETQKRFNEATSLIVKMNNLEAITNQAKFEDIIRVQTKMASRDKLQSDAQIIIDIIKLISNQYSKLSDEEAISNLWNEIGNNSTTDEYKLPNVKDVNNIIIFSSIEKMIDNDELILKVRVPVVYKQKYRKLVLIAVPNKNRSINAIDVTKHPQVITTIIMSDNNNTYAKIEDLQLLTENIYQTRKFHNTTTCLKNILINNKTTSCITYNLESKLDNIFVAGRKILVQNEVSETQILCKDIRKNYIGNLTSHLITLPDGCTIKTNTKFYAPSITEHFYTNTTFLDDVRVEYPINITANNISTISHTADYDMQAIQHELHTLQSNNFDIDWDMRTPINIVWCIGTLILLAFVAIGITFLKYKCASKPEVHVTPIKWSDIWTDSELQAQSSFA